MKIQDVHPLYTKLAPQWRRCRDFLEGKDALVEHDLARYANGARGSFSGGGSDGAYIPQISEAQTRLEYFAYLVRAPYYNVVGRSRDGFRGLIMGKGAEIENVPQVIQDDCDLEGTPLEEKIDLITSEVLSVGRIGVLVDMPSPEVMQGLSRLDAEQRKVRPYLVTYTAEDIIYWERKRIGYVTILARVVLKECGKSGDGKDDTVYRELLLDGEGYKVRLWMREAEGKDYVAGPDMIPVMGDKPIPEIPFYFFDPVGGRSDPCKPPLLDLVELARSHWQTSADLEHAAFTTSLPTPVLTGFPDDYSPTLGGLNFIASTNPEAKASYLEYQGQGLEALEKRLAAKEAQIAKLGARMLADEKKAAEAAETMRIRTSGESATLADIARSVGRIAGQALSFAARWMGQTGDVTVTLTTDYSSVTADAQEVGALDKAITAGHYAQSDFNAWLRKVGYIDSERDDDDIETDLEAEAEKRQERAADALAQTAAKLGGAAGKPGVPVKAQDSGSAKE